MKTHAIRRIKMHPTSCSNPDKHHSKPPHHSERRLRRGIFKCQSAHVISSDFIRRCTNRDNLDQLTTRIEDVRIQDTKHFPLVRMRFLPSIDTPDGPSKGHYGLHSSSYRPSQCQMGWPDSASLAWRLHPNFWFCLARGVMQHDCSWVLAHGTGHWCFSWVAVEYFGYL